MSTKIDELLATLRNLITDQTRDLDMESRDLKMAMSELASVAAERDNARQSLRAAVSKSAAQGLTLATLCDLVLGEDAQVRSDDALVKTVSKLAAERDKLKCERDSANWSLSRAKESLRAAEADVEEIDTLCNDFRRANSRLSADLAAATQRADTADGHVLCGSGGCSVGGDRWLIFLTTSRADDCWTKLYASEQEYADEKETAVIWGQLRHVFSAYTTSGFDLPRLRKIIAIVREVRP